MSFLKRFFFIFSFFLFSINCSTQIKGEFAWTVQNRIGIGEPERSIFLENKFKTQRANLYFYTHETIWWIYRIKSGFYFSDEFLVALYENNQTPQPILSDLREGVIEESGDFHFIRYFYENLKEGKYLLRIAYDTETIDEVEFYVF